MPCIITAYGYKIYFWSNEGDPLESVHVHVSKTPKKNSTKIWILEDGNIELENNNSQIPTNLLSKVMSVIEDHTDEIIDKWKEHFPVITYHNSIEKTDMDDYDER